MSPFFDFNSMFTHIMPDLVQEITILGSKFCPVCELSSFTVHLALHSTRLQIVPLLIHGSILITFHGLQGNTFYMIRFAICHNFGLFFHKSAKNMEEEWSYQKINMIFALSTLKYPHKHPFLFMIWEQKSLALKKDCTCIVSFMWPENLEFVFLWSLFHCCKQIHSLKRGESHIALCTIMLYRIWQSQQILHNLP